MLRIHSFKQGPLDNVVYLIACEATKEAAIVDPAWDLRPIFKVMAASKYTFSKVLLTHGHSDHVNALPTLLRAKSVPVYLSQHEHDAFIPDVQNIHWTSDGDRIRLGDEMIRCIHTPGHSPGHQCFLNEHQLISGDMVFIDGAGHCKLEGADAHQLYRSMHHVIMTLPDSTVIFPGHDYGPTPTDTLGNQKKHNPYMLLTNEDAFVAKRLS